MQEMSSQMLTVSNFITISNSVQLIQKYWYTKSV